MSSRDIEADLVSAALQSNSIVGDADLVGDQFEDPQLGAIWDSIRAAHGDAGEADQPVGETMSPDRIIAANRSAYRFDPGDIVDLLTRTTGMPLEAPWYITTIQTEHRRRHIARQLERARSQLTTAPDPDAVLADLALDAVAPVSPTGPRLWDAKKLRDTEQPAWLAKHRLPRAAVSILVGDEGIGKSLFWVWITAAITTGAELPEFGIPARDPGRVCLVLTEDHWSFTVRPRLEAAGAELDMISVICTEDDGTGSPVFPRDMPLVRAAGADLVVVDAFLDTVAANISMKDPQQARLALHPWAEAATDTGAAILLLTHTNRVDSKSARDRYGITGELRKKARMTLYAQEDEAGQLVIGPEKSNITMKVPASMFRIVGVPMFPVTEDHDGTVPVLEFVGESDKTAREHLEANFDAAHADPGENGSEAEEWLTDYLTLNPAAPSKEVKAAAKRDAGISERTLKRAANSLNVVTKAEGFPRTTTWSLPNGASQATAGTRLSDSGPTGPTVDDKEKDTAPLWQSGQSGHLKSNGPPGGTTGDPTGRCRLHPDHPMPAACWQCRQVETSQEVA